MEEKITIEVPRCPVCKFTNIARVLWEFSHYKQCFTCLHRWDYHQITPKLLEK